MDPTVPIPGAGAPGQFLPPTDPWSPHEVTATPTPAPQPPVQAHPAAATSGVTATNGGPVVAQIGEISVTSSVVHTPAGDLRLAGSTWQVSDFWQTEQKTPTWAIVLAIVGFCVVTVFSLLFLLVKQTVHRGTVQVTVTSGARQYVARIPVASQEQVQSVHQQVNYVRALAAL